VYDQGYKYLFGTFTPNQTLTEPLSDIVKKQAPGVQRVAILARNDLFPLAIAQGRGLALQLGDFLAVDVHVDEAMQGTVFVAQAVTHARKPRLKVAKQPLHVMRFRLDARLAAGQGAERRRDVHLYAHRKSLLRSGHTRTSFAGPPTGRSADRSI